MMLLAAPLSAQTLLPMKPQAAIDVKLTDGTRTWKQALIVPHRTADRSFIFMSAISQAATLADDFNTVYALKRQGTSEANPALRGKAALFGVTEGLFVVSELFAYRAKREDDALAFAGIPGHKYAKWWVIPMLNIAPHVVGVGLTLWFTGR
jgi:hypothetical protein